MLHHIELYVSDLAASRAFWVTLLRETGYRETAAWAEGFTLAHDNDAYLTFVQVAEKNLSKQYHRCAVGLNHLAFKIQGRANVDALRDYCRASAIPCLYEDRYPFANGEGDYYALYIEDPDRIKVEFVAV